VAANARVGSAIVTSVVLWDDRAEARVTEADSSATGIAVMLSVAGDDRTLHVSARPGTTVAVDLRRGRDAEVAIERRVELDASAHVERLLLCASASVVRDPSIDNLNAQRRQIAAAAHALGIEGVAERFDADVAALPEREWAPSLTEVVPLALGTGRGSILSLEAWSSHWRLVVAGELLRGTWTAVDDRGHAYGGGDIGSGAIRFDPALAADWSRVTISWLPDNGAEAIEIEVVR
jgi:hypothetical protein